ncbi:HAD family hydrolase [Azospirillum formosense]|uniref:HAD family hydrolase n=1 Tax=Azospirillum formosense TaxID=861533 RepID=UPI00338D44FB
MPMNGYSLWRQDAALTHLDPSAFDLISLDVFDTLLLRRCGPPEAVFERVAQAARAAALLDPSITDDAFVILRRRAEAQARQQARGAARGEIRLTDIYQQLGMPGVDRAALERLEREAERETVVANPILADFLRDLRRRGMPVVLVSDMYLEARDIRNLLDSAGIAAGRDYERLYVSCEHGASKAGGALFRMMLADRPGLPPARVLHIGDNPVTDKAGATAAGIQPLHYAPSERLVEMLRRETLLGYRSCGPLAASRGLAARGAVETEPEDRFWHGYGATVIGPIAVHYANWVVRDAAARGIRRIAPLMREGELLGQLMVMEAGRLGIDVEVTPLAVSRAALYLPSLTAFGEAEFRQLGAEIYLTVRDAAAMLDLGPLPEALRIHGDVPLVDLLGAEFGENAEGYRALRLFLLGETTQDRILARARQARGDLIAYLEEQLADAGPVALVDIGARGSMFERLARIPELKARYDFHGYIFYATPEALHRMAQGISLRTHMPLTARALERATVVYRSPQFLELLLNGEAETTAGYHRNADGRVVPVVSPAQLSDAQRRALRACRSGIFDYREQWARLAGAGSAWDAEVAPDSLLGILYRAVHLPTEEEARRIGRLTFDVNNGSPIIRPLCDDAAHQALESVCAAAPPALWLSLALQTRPSDVPWPQGTLALARAGHVEEMIDGAQGGFGHRTICRQLVHLVRSAGIDRFILCAAGGKGGMGPAFLDVAREAGIECVGYADLLVTDDGVGDGMELSLVEAAGQDCRDIVVASVGYGQAILAALRKNRREDGQALRCWWYDGASFRSDRLS